MPSACQSSRNQHCDQAWMCAETALLLHVYNNYYIHVYSSLCLGHILTSAIPGGWEGLETAAGVSGLSSGVVSIICPPATKGKQ